MNSNIPPNTISLYGQNDAMDDFPVLKAFQQYIDVEQAKAQKRMVTLCVFFAIILSIVIGVFVLLLMNLGQRNNNLNDQLVQYMMTERAEKKSNIENDATVKILQDSMSAMQKQFSLQQASLIEQQTKLFEQQAKLAEEKTKLVSTTNKPVETAEQEAAKKAELAKMKKARALLQTQKDELAREREALRQEKLEMQRRRLYPEFYNKGETTKPAKKEVEINFDNDDDELFETDSFDSDLDRLLSKPLPSNATTTLSKEDKSVKSPKETSNAKEKATEQKVATPKVAEPKKDVPAVAFPELEGWDIPLD